MTFSREIKKMILFYCKKCNTIFEVPIESNSKSLTKISVCPECKRHDIGKIAS